MKIVINEILAEGLDLQEEIDPKDLNIDADNAHYPDTVHVKVHADKSKDILTVDCDISVKKTLECSRCLAEFETTEDKADQYIYKLSGEHVIELNDNIKDTIILDNPIRILCKEECKGLCAQCGKNLNEGPCGCKRS